MGPMAPRLRALASHRRGRRLARIFGIGRHIWKFTINPQFRGPEWPGHVRRPNCFDAPRPPYFAHTENGASVLFPTGRPRPSLTDAHRSDA